MYFNPTVNLNSSLAELNENLNTLSNMYPNDMILVGGDFNCRVSNQNEIDNELILKFSRLSKHRYSVDTILNSRGKQLIESMENNGMILLNGRALSDNPAQFTHISPLGSSVIDLAWINIANITEIYDLEVLEIITHSDHFPVKVTLNTTIKMSKSKSGIKWKKDLHEWYSDEMFNSYKIKVTDQNVNKLAKNLEQAICETAERIGMSFSTNPRSKIEKYNKNPWYDRQCMTTKNNVKKKLAECKKNKFETKILNDYNKMKYEYKKLIKIKKNEFEMNKTMELANATNPKQFWEIINRFRYAPLQVEMISLEDWGRYFKEIYSRVEVIPQVLGNRVSDTILDSQITLDETLLSLIKCKNGKSPGSDNISSEFYKFLPENWIYYLNLLFNRIMEEEIIPDSWAQILTKMIYKNKGTMSEPENYRPISLVNSALKIFTQILGMRLNKWTEKNKILPEYQSGFRSGRGYIDNVFTLNALAQIHLSRPRSKVYCLFIDFKRAFDSVAHSLL